MLDWRRCSGRRLEGAERGATEDVFFEPLLHIGALDGSSPVQRSETQHLLDGPGRQEAEQVAQVTQRLEPVHFAAGEQRDESGIDFAAVVISDEKPVASTATIDHFLARGSTSLHFLSRGGCRISSVSG